MLTLFLCYQDMKGGPKDFLSRLLVNLVVPGMLLYGTFGFGGENASSPYYFAALGMFTLYALQRAPYIVPILVMILMLVLRGVNYVVDVSFLVPMCVFLVVFFGYQNYVYEAVRADSRKYSVKTAVIRFGFPSLLILLALFLHGTVWEHVILLAVASIYMAYFAFINRSRDKKKTLHV